MPRFLLEHRHTDETCPARDPAMAKGLADHIKSASSQFGVTVLSDAIFPGEHTLHLVVEADSLGKVDTFMTPFRNVGPVTIKPVITCETVLFDPGSCGR